MKVGGERAYELARSGETPELAARPVTVYRAELLSHDDERARFEIECSSGTYVRSLVTDLGDAYCEELERTADRSVPPRGRGSRCAGPAA